MRASCSAELMAPMSVFLSSGSPTRSVSIRRRSLASSCSATLSCTSSRDPAQQTWPWLKVMPVTMPSTAWSSAASSKTMFAPLPPSSRVRRLPVPASARWIALPTSVEPVKAILSTPSCATSAWPVRPSPVTTLTTPAGSPAWRSTSQKSSAVSGVDSAGFSTTVLPVASAGATFHASISSGKFHGMIWAATPSGLATRPGNAYSSLSAQPA